MSKQMKDTPNSNNVFHLPANSFHKSNYNHYLPSSNMNEFSKLENNSFYRYGSILNLQKTAGNQAIQLLIKTGRIQTKLKVSNSTDPYEQEADRVAEQIVNNTYSFSFSSLDSQFSDTENKKIKRKCGSCKMEQQKEEEKKDLNINKKAINKGSSMELSYNHFTAINSILNESGKPLDKQTRDFMEPRFGRDFSGVKIHADNETTSRSAESVNALAYTVDNNIVFKKGQYNPNTNAGKKLLAHELTHVIQQTPFDHTNFRSSLSNNNAHIIPMNLISNLKTSSEFSLQRDYDDGQIDDPGIPGENYYFGNQMAAREAALLKAAELGSDHYIEHHPSPRIGHGHYHVYGPTRFNGHFFYGKGKPKKEKRWERLPSWDTLFKILMLLGFSILAIGAIIAALADPEPVSKLLLIGLSYAMITLILNKIDEQEDTGA